MCNKGLWAVPTRCCQWSKNCLLLCLQPVSSAVEMSAVKEPCKLRLKAHSSINMWSLTNVLFSSIFAIYPNIMICHLSTMINPFALGNVGADPNAYVMCAWDIPIALADPEHRNSFPANCCQSALDAGRENKWVGEVDCTTTPCAQRWSAVIRCCEVIRSVD